MRLILGGLEEPSKLLGPTGPGTAEVDLVALLEADPLEWVATVLEKQGARATLADEQFISHVFEQHLREAEVDDAAVDAYELLLQAIRDQHDLGEQQLSDVLSCAFERLPVAAGSDLASQEEASMLGIQARLSDPIDEPALVSSAANEKGGASAIMLQFPQSCCRIDPGSG
ncbi:MAG: hypothetical protein CMP23_08730 [Rickettsiales bacterium]|nr:hypothetical protein [Rickettsiales bacterium]|tara:strand:+ start:457 stop:969 length:513 start_codon:yes stop_codon:yes gene_type:complete